MNKPIAVGLICATVLLPRFAFAWGAAGHEVIAAEAYRALSPELQAEAISVLQAHPDYAQWKAAYHPNSVLDVYAYAFIRASTWPDEIRRSGSPYDHPEWHFIDYPLRPPDFPMLPGPTPDNDVLFGVAQCEKVLADTNAAPELRAVMLSYLIHLVGDMHQPLHCASLFTKAYPTGDRGANEFYVAPGNMGVPLHGLWDGLLGSAANPRSEWNYGLTLDTKYPRSTLPELTTDTTPKSWSLESRQLAIDKVYLHGQLQGSVDGDSAPTLPPNYLKNGRLVAERQGALAGYRLADEIQKYLTCSTAVPLLPPNTYTNSEPTTPMRIAAGDAAKYYDETMIVTGKVVQVSERPSITIINLGQPGGATANFSAVIFALNVGDFGDLQKLDHQDVEFTGDITEYHGAPEMVLESTNQINIVGGH